MAPCSGIHPSAFPRLPSTPASHIAPASFEGACGQYSRFVKADLRSARLAVPGLVERWWWLAVLPLLMPSRFERGCRSRTARTQREHYCLPDTKGTQLACQWISTLCRRCEKDWLISGCWGLRRSPPVFSNHRLIGLEMFVRSMMGSVVRHFHLQSLSGPMAIRVLPDLRPRRRCYSVLGARAAPIAS